MTIFPWPYIDYEYSSCGSTDRDKLTKFYNNNINQIVVIHGDGVNVIVGVLSPIAHRDPPPNLAGRLPESAHSK